MVICECDGDGKDTSGGYISCHSMCACVMVVTVVVVVVVICACVCDGGVGWGSDGWGRGWER